MEALNIYNQIINNLMRNDRNATWDEILTDNENNFTRAVAELKECLERIINEEGYEGEKLKFYTEQLNIANSI